MGNRGDTSGARHRLLRACTAGVVVVLLALLLAPCSVTSAGDPELAKFLLQGARDDYAKKLYDDALKKLEKTAKEDPTLLEPSYWVGMVQEGKRDVRAAVRAYRAYRDAYDEKRSKGLPSKADDVILAKVLARLAALAGADTEFERIQTGFVSQLHSFAEENFVRDPEITRRALRMLLDVRPKNDAGRRLLERLGGRAPEAGDDAALGVKAWNDFISRKAYEAENGYTYAGEIMTVEHRTGTMVFPPRGELSGTTYVIDVEVRFVEEFTQRLCIGVAFANREGACVALMVTPDRADFVQVTRNGEGSMYATAKLPERMELASWRRFTILVEGSHVEVRLGDKKLIDAVVGDRDDLDGDVGTYVQESRVEFRRLRVGRRG